MARSVPLSRFTSRVGGGSAFFVRPLRAMKHFILLLFLTIGVSGCLPLTVNQTRGESPICPVHHIAMTKERVDIGGMIDPSRDAAFPFARYRARGGCIPPQPMWAKVYVCPECKRGYFEKHGHNPY